MCEAVMNGQRMYVVDAHKGGLAPRYIVRADTLLGAILKLKWELICIGVFTGFILSQMTSLSLAHEVHESGVDFVPVPVEVNSLDPQSVAGE